MTSLDTWLNDSSNFNLFVGIVSVVAFIGAAVYTYLLNRIGKKDEYSMQIRLNVTNKMFISLTLLFAAFIFLVPDEMVHYKLLIVAIFAITALVGAVTAAYYYIRDFRN